MNDINEESNENDNGIMTMIIILLINMWNNEMKMILMIMMK